MLGVDCHGTGMVRSSPTCLSLDESGQRRCGMLSALVSASVALPPSLTLLLILSICLSYSLSSSLLLSRSFSPCPLVLIYSRIFIYNRIHLTHLLLLQLVCGRVFLHCSSRHRRCTCNVSRVGSSSPSLAPSQRHVAAMRPGARRGHRDPIHGPTPNPQPCPVCVWRGWQAR